MALYRHGIPYDPSLTLVGNWERDCGYALGEQLIQAGATAIFAHNDLMAMGVLDYCNANGINVAPPLFEIGQTASRELFGILAGKEPQQHTIMLDCTVIERESTHGTEETP